MDYRVYQNKLSQLSARFNLMVCLVFGLLIANVVLSFLVYMGWNRHSIEITPFYGSPGYIKSAQHVDENYLSLMTKNFVYARLNVTPETVHSNHEQLLAFVNPKHYADFVKTLNAESKIIKAQKISSNFYITHIFPSPQTLTVKVKGRLARYVGIKQISEEARVYKLAFRYAQGRLSIVQFAVEKENKNG
ncbi:type IV conjugative transfer system protein TraE [Legionella saoudiensis]|uniref:type IV conjugative transfer system protein TraE n=1 Tax=Legionella saoudiensis TaxID=1750561 RepID=UPI0007302EAE|nr:type IV conjugative transfer system protein TraE [Legionella saoudiensis]